MAERFWLPCLVALALLFGAAAKMIIADPFSASGDVWLTSEDSGAVPPNPADASDANLAAAGEASGDVWMSGWLPRLQPLAGPEERADMPGLGRAPIAQPTRR